MLLRVVSVVCVTLASLLVLGGEGISIPYRITGFISQSGRVICLEVQEWYLLAGMTWQIVAKKCSYGEDNQARAPAPQIATIA